MQGFGREVILGVGGGIAAYKSCDLLRRLRDLGYGVTVVPTPSSLNFVGSATWEALSGRKVTTEVFESVEEVRHVSLAKNSNFIIIAPATADLMARIAAGRADDLLTNVILASNSPVLIVPAMHPEMWSDEATKANVATLRSRGYHVMDPDTGALTSGDVGQGRFPETSRILGEFAEITGSRSDLLGKKVLITAGGTREAIDPVRFIGNKSSGKQGYALANAFAKKGFQTTLISGPTNLPIGENINLIKVETAQEMLQATKKNLPADVAIFSAAVADFKVKEIKSEKIKKNENLNLELEKNIDILNYVSKHNSLRPKLVIGFAAETNEIEKNAKKKLVEKNCDWVVANDVSNKSIGFDSDFNEVSIFYKDDEIKDEKLSLKQKSAISEEIVDRVIQQLN